MNDMELLCLFGAVRDEHILEANRKRSSSGRPSLSRTALIAAIVAVLMLLAGCVAVFMKLEDRKIGQFTYTRKFDDYGNAIDPTEKVYDTLTLSGKLGSPNQLATREWYEFTKAYDPDHKLLVDDPDLPEVYKYNYSCYTQEMADALDAIVEKQGIKLLGTQKVTQREQYQDALNCLGIESLLLPGAKADYRYGACWLFPPDTFDFDITLTLEDTSLWEGEVWTEYYYLNRDYLYPHNLFSYDLETCQQWEYVTADGTKALLVLDNRTGTILTEKEGADIAILLDFVTDTFLDEDTVLPTKETLEAFADLYDYNVRPREIDVNLIPPEEIPVYEPPTFAGYADYVNSCYAQPQYYQYAFYDVDGNGIEDLLVGYQDDGGNFTDCWTLVEEKAQRLNWGPARGSEDGIFEFIDQTYADEYTSYFFNVTGWDPAGVTRAYLATITYKDGTYHLDGQEVTKERVQEVWETYRKPIQLTWMPLMEFPMDSQGTTFADILEAEGTPTEAELVEFYARQDYSESYYEPLQYFCLRDMNGDGITDLLLSVDREMVNASYTALRGKLHYLHTDFYLYDGGWEAVSYSEDLAVGKVESHFFYYQENRRIRIRDDLIHFLSTDTWQNERGDPVAKEAAEAILTKYPRIQLPFRPISELTG